MKGEGYLGRNRKMTVIRCRPSLVGGSGCLGLVHELGPWSLDISYIAYQQIGLQYVPNSDLGSEC
jgi:hypothetical protein